MNKMSAHFNEVTDYSQLPIGVLDRLNQEQGMTFAFSAGRFTGAGLEPVKEEELDMDYDRDDF